MLIVESYFHPPPSSVPNCLLCRVCPSLSGEILPPPISSPSHSRFLQVCLIGEGGKRDRERPVLASKPPERPFPSPTFLLKKEYESCCMCMKKYVLHLNVRVIPWRKGDRIPCLLATSHFFSLASVSPSLLSLGKKKILPKSQK